MINRTHLIVLFLLLGGLTVAADEPAARKARDTKRAPLTLSLSSYVAPAPALVTARISVERDARSRLLRVEWWQQDGAGGSHEVMLDGARAAARQDFAIKHIEPGEYQVTASLLRDDGSVIRKDVRLIVVGQGVDYRAIGLGADRR
jgi:hypothetical protein